MKEIILTHTLLNKKFVGDDSIVVDIDLDEKYVSVFSGQACSGIP